MTPPPKDKTAPKGTVLINDGAKSTGKRGVALSLTATDEGGTGIRKVRFSNNGKTWSMWKTYAESKAWTLTREKGLKNVYVEFRDGAGNVSEIATDTIRRVRR